MFAPGARLGLCLLLFFELIVALAASAQFPLFQFRAKLDMNMAIQLVLSAALSLQPDLGTPAEYNVYSGRIGGLMATKLIGASPELIIVWGAWVQGGTSWAPYL